jgi:hypothetical protein
MLELALKAHHELPQVSVVYRMPFGELPEGRNPFGFKDGLHNPDVEGSGPTGHAGNEQPIKPGEFVLGYPDEHGETANVPIPAELRRNGTFVAIRKFHMDVAAFRRYLRAQADLKPDYFDAYRARMNANLAFHDGLDGKIDWPFDQHGDHPLTRLLLADFLVVDASRPFTEASYFEIERSMLERRTHVTPGGRWAQSGLHGFRLYPLRQRRKRPTHQ